MNKIINISLRGSTLLGKFLLIFFLARVLEPQAVGLYGLVAVTVAYGLYLVGFDFYTFGTRDLMKREKKYWGQLLKSQVSFFFLMYALVIPLSILLFVFELLPWSVFFWFVLLLVLEHLSQELNRLLVVMSRQLAASMILFLRSGAWCVVVIAWMWYFPSSRSLETVLKFWVGGNILAVLLGAYYCVRLEAGGWREPINWQWVRQGLKVAIPLLIGTLALRGIYTIDRYWFEELTSIEILGAYVLFMGMCNALQSFLDAGVFMYAYPDLIKKYNNNDSVGFKKEMRKLAFLTVVICVVFLICSAIVLPYILQWLDREVYKENVILFWWLLSSMIVFVLGMIPHYGLYAKNIDIPIIRSHFYGLLIFFPSVWVFSLYDAYLAIPASLCFVFLLMFFYKSYFYMKNRNVFIKHNFE